MVPNLDHRCKSQNFLFRQDDHYLERTIVQCTHYICIQLTLCRQVQITFFFNNFVQVGMKCKSYEITFKKNILISCNYQHYSYQLILNSNIYKTLFSKPTFSRFRDNLLKLFSWNIEGLTSDKVDDPYFQEIISKFDLIIFVETDLSP